MLADTNTYLLMGLKNHENGRVWEEFCARYRPLLISFGRRLGLAEDDSQDVAQDTLLAFAESYRRGLYDREKGRLRTWLLGIARNQIYGLYRRAERHPVLETGDNTDLLSNLPADDQLAALWQSEWQKALVAACLAEVKQYLEETTIRAFELFVLNEWPADKVAAQLGISRNAVFKAKRRVLTHMREAYRCMEDFW